MAEARTNWLARAGTIERAFQDWPKAGKPPKELYSSKSAHARRVAFAGLCQGWKDMEDHSLQSSIHRDQSSD